MRYRRAVEKLRILAEECDSQRAWPGEDPLLREAYVFGDLFEGPDELERVELALVLGLSPERVAWASTPRGALWLEESLRLNTGGFAYYWRSHLDTVVNHRIRGPVRFWSRESGPDETVLQALAERRFDDLPRVETSPDAQRKQLAGELATALDRLRSIRDSYWDHPWRREHRGYGRYPENELWEAVQGYLDLCEAANGCHHDHGIPSANITDNVP